MKTNQEISTLIFKAILKDAKEERPQDQPSKTLRGNIEIEIEGINFFTYYEVCALYNTISITIRFDLYDIHGHKMKSDKENILKMVEQHLIEYYEEVCFPTNAH